MTVYHRTGAAHPPRRRPRGPLPLRTYLVLKYLRAVLTPGAPTRLSNAAIRAAVGYGSEGEISQIMRWLSGDLPLSGRWAHRYLDTPQLLRYVARERRPDGGYTTTLLATPTPIVLADHDPLHDPRTPDGAQESAVFAHDPPPGASFVAPAPDERPAQGDHAIDSSNQTQKKESGQQRELSSDGGDLYRRLMAEPDMSRSLARRIAAAPLGSLADFERDLARARAIPAVSSPLYFTVARWRDGQRVAAQESEHVTHAATHPAAPARPRQHRRSADHHAVAAHPAVDYDALLAEIRALNPGM